MPTHDGECLALRVNGQQLPKRPEGHEDGTNCLFRSSSHMLPASSTSLRRTQVTGDLRWRRMTQRFAGADEKRGAAFAEARHYTFSTCPYSSSTGVERPKIDTLTFTRPFSSSTSSTVPLKLVNGPSATRTCSPTSNRTAGRGRSTPSCVCFMMRSASASLIGLGL